MKKDEKEMTQESRKAGYMSVKSDQLDPNVAVRKYLQGINGERVAISPFEVNVLKHLGYQSKKAIANEGWWLFNGASLYRTNAITGKMIPFCFKASAVKVPEAIVPMGLEEPSDKVFPGDIIFLEIDEWDYIQFMVTRLV